MPSRSFASATTRRRSATPEETAETGSKWERVRPAMMRARVVLPEPGGPQRTIEGGSVGLDRLAQEAALADDVLLADELVEGCGPHAGGEGRLAGGPAFRRLGEHVGGAGTLGGWHYGHRLAQTGEIWMALE